MQMPVAELADFIQHSILVTQEGTSIAPLPFNPIKLLLLILWFYLCLYFTQHAQFSHLVPNKFKSIACIISLVAGPALFLVLLLVDTVKKSSKSGESTLVIIRQQIKNTIIDIWSKRFRRHEEDDSKIRLLDSSGTELKEIYGHGDSKGQNRHILDLTEQIIADALGQRASDILIDPKDDLTYTIRLRIDGVLIPVKQLKTDTCKAVINSIKAVSSMDISEKRRPQDGAFMAKQGEMTASFRVASAGVIGGEKLSIRILNQNAKTFTLTDVGFTKKQCSDIEKAMQQPSGMLLICGPTGSGKTTTMYAMLNQLDRYTRNVITVEDPIEAVLPESSQIEINPKADITFAKALRSILRQDPDVICVGEIRDEETAEIALRASQTGHLVLATVHCGSNSMALVRLMDLGVSPLLLSSGLSLLISQRLIRLLCNHCKRPAQLTQSLIDGFSKKGIDYTGICEAVGCKRCNGTGYFERTAISDIMEVTDKIKADIINNTALISELKSKGSVKDITNLRREGLKIVIEGRTSLQELKRVVG
jgi:general secretion pathway protein E